MSRRSSFPRPALLCALLAPACSTTPLAPSDGGASDLAAVPDAAAGSCATIAAQVQAALAADDACTADTDCLIVSTDCGLPGVCGAFLNTGGYDAIAALLKRWHDAGCAKGAICPPCPPPPTDTNCVAGRCAPAPAPNAGAPCTGNADCASVGQYMGICLGPPTHASFNGGYCALPCAHGFGCPWPSLACTTIGGGDLGHDCFLRCTTDGDCRAAEGYACCPATGFGASGSVCRPAPCP